MDNYHKKLDKLQRDIDWIIHYLQKQNEPLSPPPFVQNKPIAPPPFVQNKPIAPPPFVQNKPIAPPPFVQNSNVTYCSKCGITFSGITNYWCPQQDCPIQTKATL